MKKPNKITKTSLAKQASDKAGVSVNMAEKLLNAVLEVIAENLAKGNDIVLTGFGNFKKSIRKARTGTNPQTGQKIQLPESKSVSFKPSKALKDKLV